MTNQQVIQLVVIGVIACAVLYSMLARRSGPLSLWIQAYMSNGSLSFGQCVTLWWTRKNPEEIVYARIRSQMAGLDIPLEKLVTHSDAKGDLKRVVSAMIAAKGAKLPLTWEEATAKDLAGIDPFAEIAEIVKQQEADKNALSGV
jgi:uncharacterized protein YqfA (UPF0365 family)